jgi:hypothetical protein
MARTGAKIRSSRRVGGARHHSASAPQFRGGGRAHGPVIRSHAHDLPKKVRALALRHALSAKARRPTSSLLTSCPAEAKTKALTGSLSKLGPDQCAVHRRRRVDRISPCGQEHSECGCAAGPGHQCLRHPAPRQAGLVQGRGRSSGGALQMSGIFATMTKSSRRRSPKSRRWCPSEEPGCLQCCPTCFQAEIKAAVEALFGVKVTAVNTLVRKGKVKRFRGIAGRQTDVKKAYRDA